MKPPLFSGWDKAYDLAKDSQLRTAARDAKSEAENARTAYKKAADAKDAAVKAQSPELATAKKNSDRITNGYRALASCQAIDGVSAASPTANDGKPAPANSNK